MGGEFNDAKGNSVKPKAKLDNAEMEKLLKKGILGFIDDKES